MQCHDKTLLEFHMEDMDVEKKGGRNYLTWMDEMDEAILNAFVDHYNRGDHPQNRWKPHVYTTVVNNVRAECNVDITKENVISRCKNIDKHYVNVSKMLSTSGFGWDWIHNKLMVDMRMCGETMSRATVAISTLRRVIHQGLSYLLDGDIVGLAFLSESLEELCHNHVLRRWWWGNVVLLLRVISSLGGFTGSWLLASLTITEVAEDTGCDRYRSDDSIASMLGEKLDNFTTAYKSNIAQAAPPSKLSSPEEILDALNVIAGLDDDALLEAHDILIADDRKFKALMALPKRMKKKWILKQINQ
ncbi:hypothetical protein D1007_55353 [Hordeum vulgare]|nr:hypothetical protein D1007_55353 [Hordeum vulgare]